MVRCRKQSRLAAGLRRIIKIKKTQHSAQKANGLVNTV
jgi:hypothetical protein